MTIAFRSIGTVGTGSTTVAAGLPGSLATGDGVLLFVMTKPDTATFVTPTGWSLVADVAGGGGTTGSAVGPTRQAVFFREKDASWSTMPTVSVTSGNSTAAVAVAYSKATGNTWSTAAATGTYGSAGATTNGATTLGSNPGITAGDWCVVGYSSMSVTPTWSAQGITATGISAWGTATERSEAIETTTNNDVGGMVYDRPVTTGTATANPATQATASAATRGTVALVRLREVVPPVWVTDDFNRPDEALEASPNWITATGGPPSVAGNQVVGGSISSVARHTTPTATDEQVARCTYTGGNFLGPAVQVPAFTQGQNLGAFGGFYAFRVNGPGNPQLVRKEDASGTMTNLAADTGIVVPVGAKMELRYSGGVLTAYLDGVQVLTDTPSVVITGQRYVGFVHSTATQAGVGILDDYAGGDLAAYVAPPAGTPAAGVVDAVSGTSASATALLPAAGAAPAVSASSGAATGRLASSGSVAATSATSGSAGIIVATVTFPAAGTVAATSTATGAATARLSATGSVAGTTTASGSVARTLIAASGTVAATTTTAASAAARFTSSAGTAAATSSAVGAATAFLPTSGTVAGTSQTTGSAGLLLAVAGNAAATSTASAAATSLLPTAGIVAATSTVAGSAGLLAATQQLPASGTVTATTATAGAATARRPTAGFVAASTTSTGATTTRLRASGVTAATSSAVGSTGILRAAAGTVESTTTTTGAATLLLPSGGTVEVGSGTDAATTQLLAAAGIVTAEVTLFGSAELPVTDSTTPTERVLVVAAELRTLAVWPESRTMAPAAELRATVVAPEQRTDVVPAELRTLAPTGGT